MEHLVEAKRVLSNYCSTFNRFCKKYIKLIREISELVAKARVDDLSRKENYTGIDSGIFEMIRRLTEVYSEYMAGFYLTSEDRVAVKILRDVRVGNVCLEEGEIVFLPLREAVALNLAELALPLKSNLIKLQEKEK